MSIIRRKKTSFSVIDNTIINDDRLSLKALGLLTYMLSKPDDWEFNQEAMGRQFGEGREAMRSIMRCLTEAGYVRREVTHNEKGHCKTVTIVSEDTELRVTRQSGEPASVEPPVGQPVSILKTESLLNTEELNPPLIPPREKRRASRWVVIETILPEWQSFAASKGLDLIATETEFEKFQNYWSAANGKNAAKLDWYATWRNWTINATERRSASSRAYAGRSDREAGGWASLLTQPDIQAPTSTFDGPTVIDGEFTTF